ncbi:MAG: hypothetical protein QNJ45_18065 [Ardenticatenaceae bacterium]|nr:hypothetical protein [Ardenticatenaceae bacterium]
MSLLARLASGQDRKDEEPNKALGRELAETRDTDGLDKIAENLFHEDKRVQADCLSVLEQVGLLAPELIEDYVGEFIRLIFNRNNRLVWASMINLALIADRKPGEIFDRFDDIVKVIDKGSVITQDNGIKTLAKVASTRPEYREAISPYLMKQLKSCRPKSVAQYGESIRWAIDETNQEEYLAILNDRVERLKPSQQRRVRKLINSF